MAFVDWMTVIVRCPHARSDLDAGVVLRLDEAGELVRRWEQPLRVIGSFDASVRVQTHDPEWANSGRVDGEPSREFLRIDGNPTKWGLGHNVWGFSGDLDAVARWFVTDVLGFLNFSGQDLDQEFLRLTRVDLTAGYRVGGENSDAEAWIRAAEATAALRYRGRGNLSKGCTLYYGQHSRRWSLKFYPKGRELLAHPLPADLDRRSDIEAWVRGVVRSEVTLRAPELKKLGRVTSRAWSEDDMDKLHANKLQGLNLDQVDAEVNVSELPRSVRTTYLAWLSGADLSTLMPRSTWYLHRRKLLDFGVDISVPRRVDAPNRPVLSRAVARPCRVPDWASTSTGLSLAA